MFSSVRGGAGLLRTCLSPSVTKCQLSRLSASHGTSTQTRSYATETRQSTKSKLLEEALSRKETIYKVYKPVSPGIRHLRRPLTPHLYEGRPVRLLTIAKRKTGGRNAHGHITVRHRGGGHKQRIRTLDFMRDEPGLQDVVRIEYDPGRSAHIALLRNQNPNVEGTKKWSYIIATEGMRAGDTVQSFRQGIPDGFIPGFDMTEELMESDEEKPGSLKDGASNQSLALGILRTMTLRPGNVLPLRLLPPGTVIHNIALSPKGPGLLVRSAGSFGQIMSHEESGRYTHVRLQSGEVRKILRDCCATVGKVSNSLWKTRSLGKAGRSRWLGRRPSVRGVAMNAYVLFFLPTFVFLNSLVATIILTVVDEENQSPTNIRCLFGAGGPRVRGRGSLVRRDPRTATRWLFGSGHGAKRSVLIRYTLLHSPIAVLNFEYCAGLDFTLPIKNRVGQDGRTSLVAPVPPTRHPHPPPPPLPPHISMSWLFLCLTLPSQPYLSRLSGLFQS